MEFFSSLVLVAFVLRSDGFSASSLHLCQLGSLLCKYSETRVLTDRKQQQTRMGRGRAGILSPRHSGGIQLCTCSPWRLCRRILFKYIFFYKTVWNETQHSAINPILVQITFLDVEENCAKINILLFKIICGMNTFCTQLFSRVLWFNVISQIFTFFYISSRLLPHIEFYEFI